MKAVFGLGNPGKEYANNRHNIGFKILDYLAKKRKKIFKKKNNFAVAHLKDAILVKPLTYMNNSGKAVSKVINHYFIDDYIIILDDINLNLGDIRIRKKGGDGGHNGLKSIIEQLNSKDIKRFRVGIGFNNDNLVNHVLSDFSNEEAKILEVTCKTSYDLLNIYIKKDFRELLNFYSRIKKTYSANLEKAGSDRPKEEE